jgi:hypothetical protein
VEQVGEIEGEAGVAVGMAARLGAVAVDVRVHVDAVELHRYPLAGEGGRQGEGEAVPAQAAGEEAGAAGGAVLWSRGEFDAPVMGDGGLAPARVVVAGGGGVRVLPRRVGDPARVDEREAPAVAQRERAAAGRAPGGLDRAGRGGGQEHARGRCRRGSEQNRSACDRHGGSLSSGPRSTHN